MLLLVPLALCAQRRVRPMRLGVMGGVWGPVLSLSAADEGWSLRSKPGYHIGFTAGWRGEWFSVMPEFVYGHSVHTLGRDGTENFELKVAMGDLSVMAGAHVGIFNFEAGPAFCILGKTTSSGPEATLFRSTVGYALRAGVKVFSRLDLYVGYGGSFGRSTLSVIEDVRGGGTEHTDLSPSVVQWNAGVRILF